MLSAFAYSSLLRELILRRIRSRYIGSIFGGAWSILNPLLQLILYTVVFSVILELRFGEDQSTFRFAEFLFCALLPWMAVHEGVIQSTHSLIENANIIKKLRFPLEVIPLSTVLAAVFHQLAGALVFAIVILISGSLNWIFLPLILPILAIQIVLTYGLALLTSILQVYFRDMAQVVTLTFMALFWITPIVYPKDRAAQAGLEWILNANPLTHLVEAYRLAFLGQPPVSVEGVAYLFVFAALVLILGKLLLRRTRKELVDLL